jgi:hypothetical protein
LPHVQLITITPNEFKVVEEPGRQLGAILRRAMLTENENET